MANRERGEASLVVDGRTYTLRPSVNVLCDLEDAFNQSLTEIIARASTGDLRAIRGLLFAYLQEAHGDEFQTPKDVGTWITKAGGLSAVEGALQEVQQLNAPPAAARPPRAQARNAAGATSTSKPAAPA
jgi:Phage tail tube protein, GTA-gp10